MKKDTLHSSHRRTPDAVSALCAPYHKDTESLGEFQVKRIGMQEQKVLACFRDGVYTMMQVAVLTNILRSNVCWYVRNFRRANLIYECGSGICPITKHRAMRYTANIKLWPNYE